MHKSILFTAAIFGALSVAFGAFGAHALKAVLSEAALNTYETAVRYQFYHVFALALTGILYPFYPNAWIKNASRLFVAGIVFFSGSLYLLTYGTATGQSFRWAGPVTPLGGVMLMLGWISLGIGCILRKKTA